LIYFFSAVTRVLDSFSLIAYLEGEEGSEKMVEIFRAARDSGRDLLLSVINWGEVYYITLREAAHIISTLSIQIVLVDQELTKVAAEFQATSVCLFASASKM